MVQTANWGVPSAGPSTPTVYAGRDNDSFDSLLSGHLGTSRPAYAVQGTFWNKDTGSSPLIIERYFFDGTDDILVASFDVAANTITFPDVAKTNTAQTYTAPQRTTVVTDNDGSFDYNAAGQNFLWTPAGADTLEFTNVIAGQSGEITLVNLSGHAIAKGSNIRADANLVTVLSAAGTYKIHYSSPDGTNTDITYSAAIS